MPDQVAIVYKQNVIIVDSDGFMRAVGPDWKECPRDFSDRPCPRPGSDPLPDHFDRKYPKCRRCSYSASMQCSSQEQGIAVAKLVYPDGIIVD